MRKCLSLLQLVVLFVGVSSAAFSLGLSGVLNGTGLVDSDFAKMKEAAAGLYTAETPTIGSKATWDNPGTGASGTVELIDYDGRCAKLQHQFKPKNAAKDQTFVSRRCRAASGEWVLDFGQN